MRDALRGEQCDKPRDHAVDGAIGLVLSDVVQLQLALKRAVQPMRASADHQPIEYSMLTVASDAEEMARMLAETFCRRDPPSVAVGLTPTEFEAFVRLLSPDAVAQRLTVVARRADTGELVGALLTEDGASGLPEGMDRLSRKFDPIFDILGRLDAAYRGDRTARPGESLHLFLLGVAESASGRGVAQRLVSTCLENGVRRGYLRAITEATNEVSQHVFRKLGFVDRIHRPYRDHRFEGRAAFESIAQHGGPILMDRSLGSSMARDLAQKK